MKYQETTAAPRAVSPVSPVSLSEGAYLHTRTAGAGLPAIKAGIFATGAGIFIGILTYRFWPEEWIYATALGTVFVFLSAFTAAQREWSRIAVGLIELAVRMDLDGRYGVGNGLQEPPPVEEVERNLVLNYSVHEKDGSNVTYRQRLPISPEAMQIIADGLINAKLSLAEDNWRPKSKGKAFGDTEFKRIVNALHEAKFIRYVDAQHPNLGYVPTGVGRLIFEKYATPPPDDLPQGFTRF